MSSSYSYGLHAWGDIFPVIWTQSFRELAVVPADMFSGDENSRPQSRQFIGLLKRLARKHDCAFLLLAHPSLTGLNTGSGMSGSTGWNNAVRSRLYSDYWRQCCVFHASRCASTT
jgi:RecA-family ATPase